MKFSEIPGNNIIKNRLLNAVKDNSVSHAYIFCGKKGLLKYETAKAFADILTDGSTADIIEITNERYGIDKKNLSVDAIRKARSEIFTKPYIADKKVFIINNANEMNQECQNALLKVFEEPPFYCVIILITDNERALLQTIRSRAVTMRFAPIDDEEIKNYLLSLGYTPDETIFKIADGSAGYARELICNEKKGEIIKEFLPIGEKLLSPEYYDIYKAISFFEREKDNYELLFNILTVIFRERLLKNAKNCDIMKNGDVNNAICAKVLYNIESVKSALLGNANYSTAITEFFMNIPQI